MPDDYNLPRHTEESSRLDLQHDAYVKIVGYVLHPRIAAALPENARVADVGTGTGIWLRDLARGCPSTWSFHGFDISDAQFPKNGTEDGIKYEQLNITESIPERLQGQFDVVHLRLLVCGLVDHQWEQAARNVLQLLRPGGWIQWHESQFNDIRMFQNVPGASIKANNKLIHASIPTLNKQGKVDHNTERLRDTVQDAGFEACEQDVFTSGRVPEIRKQLMSVQFAAFQAVGRGLASKDPNYPMDSQEVEQTLKEAQEELVDGKAYYEWTMRVITGRRPA